MRSILGARAGGGLRVLREGGDLTWVCRNCPAFVREPEHTCLARTRKRLGRCTTYTFSAKALATICFSDGVDLPNLLADLSNSETTLGFFSA